MMKHWVSRRVARVVFSEPDVLEVVLMLRTLLWSLASLVLLTEKAVVTTQGPILSSTWGVVMCVVGLLHGLFYLSDVRLGRVVCVAIYLWWFAALTQLYFPKAVYHWTGYIWYCFVAGWVMWRIPSKKVKNRG